MKILFILFLINVNVFADTIPNLPPNACIEGCNAFMKDLLKEFTEVGKTPTVEPAVYSGVCHHLGQYNSDTEHHAVVLIDRVNNQPNFATIFSFFADQNDYVNWTVPIAEKEMNSYWLEHGKMSFADETARVVVSYDDGHPAYIYWMRQNPQSKDLLYITYAGTVMKSFCRLAQNLEGIK